MSDWSSLPGADLVSTPAKIYILGSNQSGATYYFTDLDLARKVIAAKAKKVQHNFGVECFKQDLDSFSFLLGWEEVLVKWWIKEAPVVTDLAQISGAL